MMDGWMDEWMEEVSSSSGGIFGLYKRSDLAAIPPFEGLAHHTPPYCTSGTRIHRYLRLYNRSIDKRDTIYVR